MYMIKRCIYFLVLCLVCFNQSVVPLHAEEQSVRPGVNRAYQDPDFQQWVRRFESPRREVFNRRYAIVEATGVKPGMVVADIGAGTGLFTRLFSKQVMSDGKVYAVDISRDFIENIMRINREQGLDNVEGIVNTPKDVSLPPDSIDLAFITDTYHHFEYPISMLTSIYKALHPGGTLVIIDFRRDPAISSRWVMGHVRANRDTVIKEITSAGFNFVEEKPILRTNYFLLFKKPAN